MLTIHTNAATHGRRFFALPQTSPGKLALAAQLAFFALMAIFFVLVDAGQRGGDTFFSNLWLTIPIVLAGVSAIAGGLLAADAILLHGERSLLSFIGVLLGAFVLFWVVAELIGHDEPSPPESNLAIELLAEKRTEGETVEFLALNRRSTGHVWPR